MNKILVRALLLVLLAAVIFTPSCKAFIWDPSGVWQFPINYLEGPVILPDTLTFSGSDSSGVVTGYTVGGMISSQSGTYTKTGDFAVIIMFDFLWSGDSHQVHLTCNSSEGTPNSMTGTGTFYVNGSLSTNLSVTATKTTNLQD